MQNMNKRTLDDLEAGTEARVGLLGLLNGLAKTLADALGQRCAVDLGGHGGFPGVGSGRSYTGICPDGAARMAKSSSVSRSRTLNA